MRTVRGPYQRRVPHCSQQIWQETHIHHFLGSEWCSLYHCLHIVQLQPHVYGTQDLLEVRKWNNQSVVFVYQIILKTKRTIYHWAEWFYWLKNSYNDENRWYQFQEIPKLLMPNQNFNIIHNSLLIMRLWWKTMSFRKYIWFWISSILDKINSTFKWGSPRLISSWLKKRRGTPLISAFVFNWWSLGISSWVLAKIHFPIFLWGIL